MPYLKILTHTVWATKDIKPLMNAENKNALCHHIREYAATKNIQLINVNGHSDHLHCLISVAAEQNIATLMNLLKGESSFWANKHLKWNAKFGWDDEYFAVSVSQSHFDTVNNYISNQEELHKKKTFQEERDEFIRNYQFES